MTPGQEQRLAHAVRDGGALGMSATAREIAASADPVGAARALLESVEPARGELGARVLGEVAAASAGAGADAAVAALAGVLGAGEDHAVLCAALESLGALADASAAREPLLALAGHPSFSVRWRLAGALRAAHLDDARVEEALIGLAADPRPIVRLEAVDALGLLWPPRAAAVDDALLAACDDPDERTVASALVGLARAGAHLPAEPLARALSPERMATVPGPGAERLLVALAVARRPEAGAPLRNLSLLWKPREPVLIRALAAAVAACAGGTRVPEPAAG